MRRRRPSQPSSPPRAQPASQMTLAAPSSVRDRTDEFSAVLQSARASHKKPPAPLGAGHLPPRSDFTRLAAQVGKDIQQTSVKLSKLTKLAQRRSLFDDPTAEIQELTYIIKQDIAALNSKLTDLQRLRDATRRSANKQAGDHSENVVHSLRGRLGATAEGFKKVLKMRTDSLAAQQDRRSHFMSNTTAAPIFATPAANVALDLGQGSLGASTAFQQAQQPMQPARPMTMTTTRRDTTYHEARADAVRQVESTIVELGQIFNQLATMVSEQGELVERIDANVDDTVSNMNAGQNQLMIYYTSIAGNRALILKVFGVLLAFLVLWTVIL
ncbi:Syntaxin [Gracilaria domingensis]|nr:Syntaxin [Gracilaria domingensis]